MPAAGLFVRLTPPAFLLPPAHLLSSSAPAAVKLTNVVAKWLHEGECVAAVTLQQLLLETSEDDWRDGVQVAC
jgi:hypothetical protein